MVAAQQQSARHHITFGVLSLRKWDIQNKCFYKLIQTMSWFYSKTINHKKKWQTIRNVF